jgi:hypothetical protein
MKYWHYTYHQNYTKILNCGFIKTTSIGIDINEKSAVWFSTNPEWEETVRKGIKDPESGVEYGPFSRDDLFVYGFPPVRIAVNPMLVDLKNWRHFRKNSGSSTKMIKHMLKEAEKVGADPKEWYVSFKDVPLSCCLQPVEAWHGIKWVDINSVTYVNEQHKPVSHHLTPSK